MSFLDRISVLILTANEEANLARTLDAVSAFPRVLVLDSGSTDATRAIAERYPNVRVQVRPFDAHATQWNHGLTACGIDDPWVLALDADYALDPALVAEIAALSPPAQVAGYRAGFRYCIGGRPLSGTLYPAQVVLFRRGRARYVQAGHTQRLVVDGAGEGQAGRPGDARAADEDGGGRAEILALAGPILHDDRKPLARWLAAQQRYAALEAAHLLSRPHSGLGLTGRIRLLGWPAPILACAYVLIVKRCLLDGRAGWIYALQRTCAEVMIALEILDRRGAARREDRCP